MNEERTSKLYDYVTSRIYQAKIDKNLRDLAVSEGVGISPTRRSCILDQEEVIRLWDMRREQPRIIGELSYSAGSREVKRDIPETPRTSRINTLVERLGELLGSTGNAYSATLERFYQMPRTNLYKLNL